jgi:hypothetical protein
MDMGMEKISRWAYLLFVIIAIVMGLVVGYMAWSAEPYGWSDPGVADVNGWVLVVMLILGVIIGITSVTTKEVTPFLIATIALVVAASANVWDPLSKIHGLLAFWATGILSYIVAFAAPAAVIIGVKAVLTIAKEK